jgi:ATP-dependent DNA helicase RecQ
MQKKALATLLNTTGGVLATMPTGSGKTLLYALPALLYENSTVLVVCPLISLMRDQLRRLQSAGIPCAIFTSDQNEQERTENQELTKAGRARILLASPERLVLPSFLRLLSRLCIKLVVVDEAHCVVTWGPSFRPEYAEISNILQVIKPDRILAITATAGKAARAIIREKVFPAGFSVQEVIAPPLRENIIVRSRRTRSESEKWLALVHDLREATCARSIVYFPRRNQCTEAALSLRKLEIHAVAYHAGLTRDERRSAETYIHESKNKVVVCATQAFGMGIDLAGVGLVVVFGFPTSIEEFFQMIGRAGRAGEIAQALLLWTGADPKKRYFHFESAYPPAETISNYLNDISKLFPRPPSRRFVSDAQVASLIRIPSEKIPQKLPGIMTALRLLGSLEMPRGNSSYLSLKMTGKKCAQDLLMDLPNTPTQRGRFISWICTQSGDGWRTDSEACTLHPWEIVTDALSMGRNQCEDVLNWYSGQGHLEWSTISPELARTQWILRGTASTAEANLKQYRKLRSDFYTSLSELERLAYSTTCRLQRAHAFFGDATTKPPHRCGQCDLCLPQP